jgi:hypothetical protein
VTISGRLERRRSGGQGLDGLGDGGEAERDMTQPFAAFRVEVVADSPLGVAITAAIAGLSSNARRRYLAR